MLNRQVAPPLHHPSTFELRLPPCQHWHLANGVPVVAVDAGVEEVLQVEWIFEAGNALETENMVAAATNFLLKNGTTTRTAFEINEAIDYYGAYLSRACYNETAVVTLHCLSKYLPQVLPVVADMLCNATFPQEELNIFVQNSKQRLAVNLMKCDFVAGREIDALLYGMDHPYGKYSTPEALDALTVAQIKAFYTRYYTQGKVVMMVAGKLPAQLQATLDAAFGHLPLQAYAPQAQAPIEMALPAAAERVVRIQNDPNGVQGAIRMARPFPNRHHPDFLGVQVLNNVFGGYFGSRLMSNIREDKGYTYGIHSFLHNHIGASAWMVSTEAGRDVCEAAIQEVYYEMQQLREGFIDEEELLLVRNYMMGTTLGSLDGPFQIIGRWKSYYLHGIADGEAYFNAAIENIKKIDAAALQALAQKYLQPEAFYEMVVV